MIKNIIIIGLSVLLIVGNILVTQNHRQHVRSLNSELRSYAELISEISTKDKNAYKYNGVQFQEIVLMDTLGVPRKISEIFTDETLILDISNNNCSSCIEKILPLFNNFYFENMAIFYSGGNLRELNFFLRNNKVKHPVYFYQNTFRELPGDIENVPCFYILSDELKLKNTYFPLKDESDFITFYITRQLELIKLSNRPIKSSN
jgi:hypothetical protein